jgi:hypothetical protein
MSCKLTQNISADKRFSGTYLTQQLAQKTLSSGAVAFSPESTRNANIPPSRKMLEILCSRIKYKICEDNCGGNCTVSCVLNPSSWWYHCNKCETTHSGAMCVESASQVKKEVNRSLEAPLHKFETKFNSGSPKQEDWKCYNCPFVFVGSAPPDECPLCHSSVTLWLDNFSEKIPLRAEIIGEL